MEKESMYVYNRFDGHFSFQDPDKVVYYASGAHKLYSEIRVWSNHRDTDICDMITCLFEGWIPGEFKRVLDNVTKGDIIYNPDHSSYEYVIEKYLQQS